MANQALNDFCTQCGAPRGGELKFCTSCGAALTSGAAAPPRPAATAPVQQTAAFPIPAVAVFLLLLAAGGGAFLFATGGNQAPSRAVSGNPGMPRGEQDAGGAPQDLPEGHPSIELPQEVTDFLAQLTAEAEKSPQSVDAWQRLARARYRASAINPSYSQSAQQALDKLLALDPANIEGLRISANIAYDAGDFVEAQKRFEAFLTKSPDDPSAITDLGSALLFQDRTDDAIAKYRVAIEKDPKFLQAHFNLAIGLQKAGNDAEALTELQRARALADSPEQQKHIDNAIADLQGTPRQPEDGAPASGGQMPGGAPPGMPGMGMGAPADATPKPSNATSDLQRETDAMLGSHAIIGSHVQSFQWTGDGDCRVLLAGFPMAQMPPFALEKFKSGMNGKLAKLAADKGLAAGIHLDLVDAADGSVMDYLGVQR
ncbi:MAG: tetratricopeptide repeat protein [Deltaproteobacteria bacterium]|nr:tetratricopeptide repeat protein [Deltaproteobacteria bacterium]